MTSTTIMILKRGQPERKSSLESSEYCQVMVFKKTTEVIPKTSEEYRRSSKVTKDFQKSREDFQKLPKIAR